MRRPCECDRTAVCRACWLWHNDDRYRRLWSGEAVPQPPAIECIHLGRLLLKDEREARGLDHERRWSLCDHPEQPLGDVVCPCRGCGSPACPGYVVES